ncbi:G-type lectin S-receptor-like serine/threonine-protein kinase At4g27290 [Glycine soja]|uniref:G-type lectin S-receptor-like serine/threonine-protein kinase At4g27290 n=1 Tax=Glycine soja TaxID=3848 RepID=UPI00103A8092|nr:G-type lectin S-receptor-like serine/threonine-protein kinase At4g27290 [Glycine soja]
MTHSIIMLCIWFFLSSYMFQTSTSLDSLAVSQSIRDGETLVSAGGITKVGFFSPENSTRRYLGIWYTNYPSTVVWVANRNAPLEKNSGVLKLNKKGILELLNATNSTIWSSNISSKAVNNPIAYLLDSGNFVLKNGQQSNQENILWQSFDYPCDTLMPGMKLGWNLETGLERSLSSWKSVDDPAEGEYTLKLDLEGYPQAVIHKGPEIKIRKGPWNGQSWPGFPDPTLKISQIFVFNEKEVSYKFKLLDKSMFSIYTLTPSGTGESFYWTTETSNQQVFLTGGKDQCENYAFCGVNSICSIDNDDSTCNCITGYSPQFSEYSSISPNGCFPTIKSNCNDSHSDDFLKYKHMKLPDTSSSWFSKTMNLEDCKKLCLENCSCVAYANLDMRGGGSGCLLWFSNLVDMRKFSQWGQDLYVRVPASKLGHVAAANGNLKKKIVGITVGVTIFGLIITCVCILILKNSGAARKIYGKHYKNIQRKEDIDLPNFNLSVLAKATENFSTKNKLGEGGFGQVYKGTLRDGKELAVKRLSKKSGQGLDELKTEVVFIAKLQHRNLVKLLGCCIEGEEKLLIYEYMANQSLDYFIFDKTKRMLLDWSKRSKIISGIARGLLYLHQDSRLRIIHRDLKTSNILLDTNFEPKISDFGVARSFLGDQDEANTNTIVGTYGYMPPEYAARGHFSVKSDVFSYGVIVLEIISGKKNREFSNSDNFNNLPGHAWRLWTEERELELLDEVLGEQCTTFEVIRCIQVGLLCVQQRPEDRPGMSSVVLMLNGDKLLPKPKIPGFYIENNITSETVNEHAVTA